MRVHFRRETLLDRGEWGFGWAVGAQDRQAANWLRFELLVWRWCYLAEVCHAHHAHN